MSDIAAQNAAKIRNRTKRLNLALIGSHVAVVLGILGVVVLGYRQPVEASNSQVTSSILDQETTSVDQIAAANVASSVAQTLDLSVQDNVQNLAVSLNAKTELAQTTTTFISKPQIVQQDTGRRGVVGYIAVGGDSVQTVAQKFGISEDTIRWANTLTSDSLAPGKVLQIPGVTGVVYTVKAGDTAATLATKYKADAERILSYNDLEVSGLQPGQRIVIPDGILPENERPGYRPAASSYNGGVTVGGRIGSYAGNGYVRGYCTAYAYDRRAQLGRPIGGNWGNAATWASYARADGFEVNKTPRAGAVFQQGGGWSGLGHVGVVERVNDDGSINVSEMNYAGWNVISSRTIPASQVGAYNYIHDRQ
ncbi:MAG TPA: LysM peptidoglycan-binding domain-containing protein [Magnetospirillaceae bacterium]|nr:LysM peptidoglycan-binding domain-containing protein [Magnetospirillaceae bacterium]